MYLKCHDPARGHSWSQAQGQGHKEVNIGITWNLKVFNLQNTQTNYEHSTFYRSKTIGMVKI